MTDYVQKKIAPGVELLAVPAGRFKTNELAIHLAVPMEEQMAANYALAISAVSRKGKAYPDMRALHLQLDKLYGAAISVTANKSGGCQILKMGITTLDDRFALDDEKIAEAGLELLVPLVVASIVDTGIGGGDKSYIIRMCLVMIGLGLVGLLCAVTAQYFAASAAVGFCTRLRHALLEHILGLSYTQIDGLGTSTLITRMTSDINQVQSGVNLTLRLLLRSPFVVFGAMIMAFTIDAQAALVFVGVIPVLCVIVFGIMLITMPKYKKVQGGLDQVTSATRQNLTGVRVLRAFCKEDSEIEGFE